MQDSPSDRTLLQYLAARDEQAAQRLFERYARRLSVLAERHISRRLAARVDGDDIVQSVFRTFFERSARGEFQLDLTGDLWCLLVSITLAKVRRQARWHQAAKRDIVAETPLQTGGWAEDALTDEPGPEDALALVEHMEIILQGLPDTYSDILCMRLEGVTRTEIAQRLRISRQTVHRALKVIQARMLKLQQAIDGGP
jgi:RNA polymerase sigma-70 factor (ECF subfamily)